MIEGVGEIDVVDLLVELGMQNVHPVGRGEVGFSCPFTDNHSFGDANPSNHMSREKLVYRCKGCGATGTAFSLVGQVLHLSVVDTQRWLRERYGDGYREPIGGSVGAEMREVEMRRAQRHLTPTVRLPGEEETVGERGIFYLDWASDHPAAEYMRGRGFGPDLLHELHYGFDSWTGRVTIPVRDDTGLLVGFKGRAIDPAVHTRYMLLGDTDDRKSRYGVGYGFDMHQTDGVIYGLHRAVKVQEGRRRKRVVLCEGEFNADAVYDAGCRISAAIGMTSLSEAQARLLRWYFDELVLFYDTDDAGFAATWGYEHDDRHHPGIVERLSPYMRVLVVEEHEGDPASLRPDERVKLVERAKSWMSIAVE